MLKDWTFRRLDELGDKKRPVLKAGPFGSAVTKNSYVDTGFKVYGQQEVVSGNVNAERYYISPKAFSDLKSCAVEAGDILITMMGTVGRMLVVPPGAEPGIINPRLMRISLDKTISEPAFVSAFLGSSHIQRLLERRAHGGTMLGLNADALGSLKIPVPPLPEQRKIAEILRTWDEAIEKLTTLRAAKVLQLDGLAASLIHDEKAERLHLREFLKNVSTRNHGQQVDRVLSVTNSAGFVLAEEQFAHRVASADLSNYKIVRRGQYAYNPSRINVGSIARLDAWEDGALSPMYVVFQVRDRLDSDFFGHWLRSTEARQRITLAAQGSVRETVSFGDLGSILVPVPTIERQKSISRALNTGCHEISLLDAETEALARQKRGLIQKLLTGEWRVNAKKPST